MIFIELLGAIVILITVLIGIRYIYIKNNERILINLVLSKLDFCPNHYKIIKKENRIYITCHYLYNNQKIYNDASLDLANHFIFNAGLKIVNIIINLDDKKYKIVIIANHIINSSNEIFNEFKNNINEPSYYFINNIIDNNLNIDNDIINIYNIEVSNSFYYIYNETANYDKYMSNRYNILLTNDNNSFYINPISNRFPNTTLDPLLSNEIRIKEIECKFI